MKVRFEQKKQQMEPTYDNAGFLTQVRGRFGFRKDLSLTKWNDQIYVHIGDNTKCWETNSFDKSKSKTVSLKWRDAVNLKARLNELEPYASQIEAELVSFICLII